jgi:chemotaxis regulatin CheY-phosphate phosphatase CheZ
VQIIATSVHQELNNFVLASILTVDDFQQFKAMMVKRNVDLTNEVGANIKCNTRKNI